MSWRITQFGLTSDKWRRLGQSMDSGWGRIYAGIYWKNIQGWCDFDRASSL